MAGRLGTTWLTNTDGDLAIAGGTWHIGKSVEQAITVRLRKIRGEWFRNRLAGVPYAEVVWVKNPNMTHIASVFRQTIADTPGVDAVLSFEVTQIDAVARKITCAWTVRCGADVVSGVFES